MQSLPAAAATIDRRGLDRRISMMMDLQISSQIPLAQSQDNP